MPEQVHVKGLAEFRRALRGLDDRSLRNGLTKIHRDIANLVKGRARAAAPGDVKRAIGHRANRSGAYLTISANPPRALGVFLGAKARFGWYARARYRGSAGRQFRPWVGNQWDPGERADSPYFIGPAIDNSVDEVIKIMADGIEDLAHRAFPN